MAKSTIVYVLIQHLANGKRRRVGVWAKRETAERHQIRWEAWIKYGINDYSNSRMEIVEEDRSQSKEELDGVSK